MIKDNNKAHAYNLLGTAFNQSRVPSTNYLTDVTCSSIHVPSNRTNLWKQVNRSRRSWQAGGVASKAYDLKVTKYAAWGHRGHIIPLALDSAGAIAPPPEYRVHQQTLRRSR